MKSKYSIDFSIRFTITPEREVNFGPMPIGCPRRVEKFLIENHGEHDFKFIITKFQRDSSPQKLNMKYVPTGDYQRKVKSLL